MSQTGRAVPGFLKERSMKIFKQTLKYGTALALATLAATAAMAQTAPASTINLTSITSAFNATDVITAVLAVAGVLAAIYATMTAAKMALRWIRGG
jgi:hypothetical protein